MINSRLEKIRQWIVVVCFAIAASIFWGAVVAAAVRYALGIEGGQALLFVGFPVAILFLIYLVPKLREVMGFK